MAFRREKFVPRGGPSGGDGGDGGSVWLVGEIGRNTLFHLRFTSLFAAERGRHGEGSNKTGRTGGDLEVPVPLGTQVYDAEIGDFLGEILEDGQRLLVAAGGIGRARQRPLHDRHQPGPPPLRARARWRRAPPPAGAQAARRRRRGGPAQRRQVDPDQRRLGRPAQDRRLPLHHPGPAARRGGRGPARRALRDRRPAGADRRRRPGGGARHPVPAPRRALPRAGPPGRPLEPGGQRRRRSRGRRARAAAPSTPASSSGRGCSSGASWTPPSPSAARSCGRRPARAACPTSRSARRPARGCRRWSPRLSGLLSVPREPPAP